MDAVTRVLAIVAWWALFAAGCATNDSGGAAHSNSVPTRLPADFENALNDVEIPNFAAGSTYVLYCVTDVTRRGRPYHNNCVPDPEHDAPGLRKAIDRAMRRTRLSPAVLDGKTVATELYYRIHIDTGGPAPRIEVYSNWGHSSDRYGTAYAAPQRYEPRRYPPECLFFSAVAITPIDAGGRVAGEPEIFTRFDRDQPTLDCIDKIKTRLIGGRYIPARHDGEMIAAIHAELWGNPENVTLDEVLDSLADLCVAHPPR